MDEYKAFFDNINKQFEQQQNHIFDIGNETIDKFYKDQEEISKSLAAKQAKEELEHERLKGIANNTINIGSKLDEKTEENKAFLEYFNTKCKASIARQQSFIPKGKSQEVKNLEELAEYTNKKIIEEKALRTTAELIDDQESITKHNITIAELESNRKYYTDQINILLANQ